MQIQESSQVIPLPGVPTLFLDVKTTEDITNSKEPRPPQDFRGFKLHRVIYLGAGPPIGQVAFPCLQGKTMFHWAPKQKQVLTPELREAPQLMVALSAADTNHWNIVNDPIFPSCLDKFKARHEASLASGAAKLTRRPSSQGESSTPTQELPLPHPHSNGGRLTRRWLRSWIRCTTSTLKQCKRWVSSGRSTKPCLSLSW